MPEGFRAKAIEVQGKILFAIFNNDNLDDIWRFTLEEGQFGRFDCYYCCPDLLREIATKLGVNFNHHGYYFEQGKTKESI